MSNIDKVIEILLAAGYTPDGQTRKETVRVPTVATPVYGGTGGKLTTFGGRSRFARGDHKATVGRNITCLYRVLNGKAQDYITLNTKEVEQIRETVNEIT